VAFQGQFPYCPLTEDYRNGQKDRGLDNGNCKQFPNFKVSARRCRSERFILKGGHVRKDQKHAAKCQDPENKPGLPERTIGLRLLRRVYVQCCGGLQGRASAPKLDPRIMPPPL
jgi:hypothetical protein